MKVYLAGPYGARDVLRSYAQQLDSRGIEATSSWLAETHEVNAGTQGAATALTDAQVDAHARQDIDEICGSHAVVLFTAAYVGGERHVETGVALAFEIPVVVVGKPENVFHRLAAGVHVVRDWSEAVELLTLSSAFPFPEVPC